MKSLLNGDSFYIGQFAEERRLKKNYVAAKKDKAVREAENSK